MDLNDNNRKLLTALLIERIVEAAGDSVSTNSRALLHDSVKVLVDGYLKAKEIDSLYLRIADTMIDTAMANCETHVQLFDLNIETDADVVEHSKAFLKDCNSIIAGVKRLNDQGAVRLLNFVTSGEREAKDITTLMLTDQDYIVGEYNKPKLSSDDLEFPSANSFNGYDYVEVNWNLRDLLVGKSKDEATKETWEFFRSLGASYTHRLPQIIVSLYNVVLRAMDFFNNGDYMEAITVSFTVAKSICDQAVKGVLKKYFENEEPIAEELRKVVQNALYIMTESAGYAEEIPVIACINGLRAVSMQKNYRRFRLPSISDLLSKMREIEMRMEIKKSEK